MRKRASAALSTASLTAINPRSSANWWTGLAPTAFASLLPAKEPNTCPSTSAARPTALAFHEFTPEQIAKGGFNPKMFNSFLDGTKQSIEMVAVANATGLGIPADGLSYAPASVYELATVLRPRAMGGVLDRSGVVDVVTSHYAE